MIKVGVLLPGDVDDAGDFLANVRALEAAGAEMVVLEGSSPGRWATLGAIAALTDRIQIVTAGPPPESLHRLSRGRAVAQPPPDEKWVEVAMPDGREAWSAMLQEREAAGTTGVIVPWDPRLIDLLRNPEPDDRSDLQMSTG